MDAEDSKTGEPLGLDLEDLAAGHAPKMQFTRILTVLLTALWMVFLVTYTGIVSDTWYLLAVGGLGIMHNLVAAGVARGNRGRWVFLSTTKLPDSSSSWKFLPKRKLCGHS